MASPAEYMQFALGVYAASNKNKIGVAEGWSLIDWQPDRWTGFSAGVFKNNTNNEIVISFTGTNDSKDVINWFGGAGLPAFQIFDAMAYYWGFKAAFPTANITFTGHSLGGGLASLMAVFFDKQATVFDEAPFQTAAQSPAVLVGALAAMLRAGLRDADLLAYLDSRGSLANTRESKVTQYSIAGEVLGKIRWPANTLVGNEVMVPLGNSTATPGERHSMGLLTAIQVSTTFLDAVQKLPNLITQLLDDKLFAADPRDPEKADLLRKLLKHQLGVSGKITPDRMLERFAADMQKIMAQGDLSTTNENIIKSLTAFAMQMFSENSNASNNTKELFNYDGISGQSGGLHFDRSDVAAKLENAKGYNRYFQNYLNYIPRAEINLSALEAIKKQLPELLDWYIQVGRSPMNAAAANQRAFMLGGESADNLTGGSANDVLMGGKGADQLNGGAGNDTLFGNSGNDSILGGDGADVLYGNAGDDTLIGGTGNDTYIYTLGDGNDTIVDTGANEIKIYDLEGHLIQSDVFYKKDASTWKNTSGKVKIIGNMLVFEDGSGITLVDANLVGGDFGINLIDIPNNPAAINTIHGDQNPQTYNDVLFSTAANDLIEGGAGNDQILGSSFPGGENFPNDGNDWFSGGDGNDLLQGGTAAGYMVIEGGTGSDRVFGAFGDDKIFGDSYGEMDALIAAGETAPGINERGDFADGGKGNDFVYGSSRNDLLFGGEGYDLLVGGGGDDAIFGDQRFSTSSPDWSFSITQGVNVTLNNASSSETNFLGDDVIYAGAGNDFVYAGGGDDEVYAGEGDDTAIGEGGNDFMEGGAGNDNLEGDANWVALSEQGNDYIDGGTGNDKIWGEGGSDELFGGDGNDELNGDDASIEVSAHGDDYLDGEAGEDTLYGQGGNDQLFGGDGMDLLNGGLGNDYLDGEIGNDTLIGAEGSDELYGGDGNDQLHGDASNVALADQGDDYIDGEGGDNLLVGYGGNDTLIAAEGNDTLYGDAGDDYIDSGDGTNSIYAGEGNNEVYAGINNDYIEAGSGDDYIDAGDGNNTIFGGNGANEIFACTGDDQISGGTGNDYIDAGEGNNIVIGGTGADTLYAGSGDDQIQADAGDDYIDGGDGNNIITGGEGNDTIYVGTGDDQIWSGAGVDEIYGGDGNDTLYDEGGDTVIYGEAGNDLIQTTDGNAYLDGGIGDDTLISGTGMDTLYGGDGNDVVQAGAGNDILEGGSGSDVYIFHAGDGVDEINDVDSQTEHNIIQFDAGISPGDLKLSTDTGKLIIQYTSEGDTIILNNYDPANVEGSLVVSSLQYNDGTQIALSQLSFGTENADTIDVVNASDNLIYAGGGNDIISTGNGNDTILGGDGDDYISGGAGEDGLYGGSGNDTYYFERGCGHDIIIDNNGSSADINQLLMAPDISPSEISVLRINNDLNLGIAGMDDTILIKDWYSSNENSINRVVFNDGTVWDAEMFWNADAVTHGTIEGDVIFGGNGNDQLYGEQGNDELQGLEGNDRLYGGEGDDRLKDYEGVNVMDGGPGDDWLSGVGGENTYIFNKGYGNDRIFSHPLYNKENELYVGKDTIIFGEGITPDNITVGSTIATSVYYGWGRHELSIDIGNGEGVTVSSFYPEEHPQQGYPDNVTDFGVTRFIFSDGSVLNLEDMLSLSGYSYQGEKGDEVCLEGTSNNDTLISGIDDDRIYALNGSDIINAGSGNDLINGGAGNDTIHAGDGCDVLIGGLGDDSLYGEAGNDMIMSGKGNDLMAGGDGDDNYIYYRGDGVDTIHDLSTDSEGNSLLFGDIYYEDIQGKVEVYDNEAIIRIGNGDEIHLTGVNPETGLPTSNVVDVIGFADGKVITYQDLLDGNNPVIRGSEGDDILAGSSLDNIMEGYGGNDILNGGDGNDIIYGGEGNDIIYGGRGNDALHGGSGSNTYYFFPGDGNDTIYSDGVVLVGNNIISFGDTIAPDVLHLELGSLLIQVGNNGDSIRIPEFNPEDARANPVINTFEFADGTVLTYDELIDKGFDIDGTISDDILTGTNVVDRINAMEGNDSISSGAGDDVLTGGTGDDALLGGSGNDAYVFHLGDGVDTIMDTSTVNENNMILFGEGITANDLSFVRNNEFLTINVASNGDAMNLLNFDQDEIAGSLVVRTLEFADGTQMNLTDFLNRAPVVANPLVDQKTMEDAAFSFTIPENSFIDPDAGDILTYSATLDDGAALPGWLAFNHATMTFSGTPTSNDIGELSLKVTAIDTSGAFVTSGFNISVQPIVTYGTSHTDYMITGNKKDFIMALGGSDIVYAGKGNDIIYGGDGTDLLCGDGGNDVIYGENDSDILFGGNGNDTLDGGTGADVMPGGAGDDTYTIDNTGDIVTELCNEGTDMVQSSITYTLGNNIEKLTLTGTTAINGTGNNLNNILTGNSAVNTLTGNNGNDSLAGGAGNDSLVGGKGSDTYLFGRTDGMDTITETSGVSADTDTLKLSGDITTTEPIIVKQDNDLYVFINSDNYMKIVSEFQQTNYGIERLEVMDGHYIARADIQTIVNTMSAINDNTGMDVMQKYNAMMADQQYQIILAQSWQQ